MLESTAQAEGGILMASDQARILVVDDEQVICDFLHDGLSERGYFCISVLNADKALAKLRTHYFDVALVDIKLPGISGMELLRNIRSHHHNTAVIMITGINNIDTAVEAMRLGALDYIVKPFDIDRVSSSINTALENREHLLVKKDSQINEESFNPMDAIAYGVEAKLDLRDGHLKMVTQRTIDIARWFGIDEAEIQRWVAARTRFDCLNKKQINSLLKKLGQDTLAQSIIGMTQVHLYTTNFRESEN
jgi:DNA-binding response OmpR family regulator